MSSGGEVAGVDTPGHPLPRRRARERALELLYEADIRGESPRRPLERASTDDQAAPVDAFVRRLVRGVADHREELDRILGDYARGWSVPRMATLDRNVLRMAVYELLHERTPSAVVIDEAVDLARLYSTENSPRFVNGVLAAIDRGLARSAGEEGA